LWSLEYWRRDAEVSIGPVEVVLFLLVIAGPVAICARLAARNGRSWGLWALLAVLLSWIAVVALVWDIHAARRRDGA